MKEVVRDLQVRSGILERDIRELAADMASASDSMKRLRRELRNTQESLRGLEKQLDRAHIMIAQLIRRRR